MRIAAEKKEIIDLISKLIPKIEESQQKQSSNLLYLEGLKQSLLDVAFKGDLV